MRHPWFVPALLAFAALAGYAAGARPVQAQSEPSLIGVGERVLIFHSANSGRHCQVLEVRGTFLRCEPDPNLRPKPQEWVNLATATEFRRPDGNR